MKNQSKVIFTSFAFAAVLGLQSYILYQQNQMNQALQAKVDQLQTQLNETSQANTKLLSKIEEIESNLELKPRHLLSMN